MSRLFSVCTIQEVLFVEILCKWIEMHLDVLKYTQKLLKKRPTDDQSVEVHYSCTPPERS